MSDKTEQKALAFKKSEDAVRRAEKRRKKRNICSECGNPIKVQIMKDAGVCSEGCRKKRDGDTEPVRTAM